jgi:transposase
MKIQDARTLPPEAQEDIRRKAVKAYLTGHKKTDIAEIFGVTRQAVTKWVNTYETGGEKALKAKRRGRGKGGKKLLPWQAAQTVKMVMDRHPDQLKLPFYLWTRQAVADLIEKRFGVSLSIWTIGRYLKAWDLTPQKPIRKAYEQNPQAVGKWLEEEYPTIQAEAREEKAMIFWGDESGLRSDHAVGRTYGRKGQTPVIPITGNRFKCNMISAISNKGQLHFMVFRGIFNADLFNDFLSRMLRQHREKIFLIVDRHPVHRSSDVRTWLKSHGNRVRMYFLPGYSPELNPDELLNQDVKSNALGRKRARNAQELVSNTRSFLWSRQRRPETVKKYFHGKHVRYAA